ncbi:hypothetical protein, conserved [Plasmodium gonderi]|uniref:HRDC domain-containing protein n=1 Tax=Plasmodium gonderi TaxID=77519 RepID=A0A1Y1JNM1_PLAGO|nr:hypothetical protein, conserved [Plasmodium gonderi]GAW83045.1 hypothetical protein, conserved [Plasmodium gonderi]
MKKTKVINNLHEQVKSLDDNNIPYKYYSASNNINIQNYLKESKIIYKCPPNSYISLNELLKLVDTLNNSENDNVKYSVCNSENGTSETCNRNVSKDENTYGQVNYRSHNNINNNILMSEAKMFNQDPYHNAAYHSYKNEYMEYGYHHNCQYYDKYTSNNNHLNSNNPSNRNTYMFHDDYRNGGNYGGHAHLQNNGNDRNVDNRKNESRSRDNNNETNHNIVNHNMSNHNMSNHNMSNHNMSNHNMNNHNIGNHNMNSHNIDYPSSCRNASGSNEVCTLSSAPSNPNERKDIIPMNPMKAQTSPQASVSNKDGNLLKILLECRSNLSKWNNITDPEKLISTKNLKLLLLHRPNSIDDMKNLNLTGFGEDKIKKYGYYFLNIFLSGYIEGK